jgi:hypothetical protein
MARALRIDFIPLGAIKRVPIGAKFVIRALKPQTAQNNVRHFDRLEAP